MEEATNPDFWERVLWKKQNFPDNFVGKSFFRVHTKGHKVLYSQAFHGSVLVTQELCSCVGLVAVFCGISENQLNAPVVLLGATLSTVIGYIIIHLPTKHSLEKNRSQLNPIFCVELFFEDLKVTLFTVVLSWFSSPIIKTLTASVATDTIQACTTALLVLHLAFHPYGADVAIVNATVSHNLGLFASVCLASRLENDLDVFVLMIVAVIFFYLLPTFRNHCLEYYGKRSLLILTSVMMFGCMIGLYLFASSLCGVFLAVLIFINGFSPLLFIYLQSYRENIYGPWDEALIEDNS